MCEMTHQASVTHLSVLIPILALFHVLLNVAILLISLGYKCTF